MRKAEQMKIKTFLIRLEDQKSFGSFAYVNGVKALQQFSMLELSFKA